MTNVRSVSAHLEANVDGYIRDMRRAGAATKEAFGSSTTRDIKATGDELRTTEVRAKGLTGGFRQLDVRTTSLTTSTGRLDDAMSRLGVASGRVDTGVGKVGRSVRDGSSELDRYSGRLQIVGDLLTMLGPAAIPIAALAVPAVAGLASQLGFAAGAGGAAILAFQGVGDALSAIEEARLDPTVDNLFAAEEALARLTPQAARFSTELASMRGDIAGATVDAAAEGLFPGLTRSLDDIDDLLPRGERIFRELGAIGGDLISGNIDSLASPRWEEFFTYLETDGRGTLTDLNTTIGNVSHSLAEMLMATDPLADGFGGWLADKTGDLDTWASGLESNDSFQKMVDYIQDNGPQVADTAGAIADGIGSIVAAAAPLGRPALAGLELVADVFSTIADSELGTPLLAAAAGLSAFNRAVAVQQRVAQGGLFGRTRENLTLLSGGLRDTETRARAGTPAMRDFGTVMYRAGQSSKYASDETKRARDNVRGFARDVGPGAAAVGGLGILATGAADGIGLTNTASMALMGTMGGPWGAAIGAAVGGLMDMNAANADLEESLRTLQATQESGDFPGEAAAYDDAITKLRDTERAVDGVFHSLSEVDEGGFLTDIKKLDGPGDFFKGLSAGVASLWGGGIRGAREELAAYNREAAEAANQGNIGNVLGQPFEALSADIAGARGEVVGFTDVVRGLGRALTGELAEVDYESALDDLTDSLAANGDSFDKDTRAGQENTRMMAAAADSALTYAKSLKPGQERKSFLQDVRKDLRAVQDEFPGAGRMIDLITRQLNRMGKERPGTEFEDIRLGAREVDNLRGSFEDLPEGVQTELEVMGLPTSKQSARAMADALDLIPAERRTLIRLADLAARTGIRNIDQLLRVLDGQEANPNVTVSTRPAMAAIGTVRGNLGVLDRFKAAPSVAVNAAQAGAALSGIIGMLNNVDGRHTSSSHTHTTFFKQVGAAVRLGGAIGGAGAEGMMRVPAGTGGMVRTFAAGGLTAGDRLGIAARDPFDRENNHPPELSRSGVARVFREQETGGEAYIPLRNDHRRVRAKQILEQATTMFGGQVSWNAEGSFSGELRQVSGGGGGSGCSHGPLEVVGELDTPWGPAMVRGVARDEADRRVAEFARDLDRGQRIRASRVRDQ